MAKSEAEIKKIREDALKHLDKYKDELAKFQTKIDDTEERWPEELALLQRRVESNIVEVQMDKEKGETIAIRGSLSDFEIGKITELDNMRKKLNPEDDLEMINEITYVILGIITANPLMTAEWFKNNRTKYSTEDMLKAYLTYQEQMVTRAQRVAQIQKFR
jgi:hypothetical protein